MFERFTERARQVVVFAQDEARALGHGYIGTEHLLLGLLREDEGLASRVLESLGVSAEAVREQVARIVGEGGEKRAAEGEIPFTPRSKKVLELALREALALGHEFIGTEHILLGIARENKGVASRILLDFGVDAERIRERTAELHKAGGSQRYASGPPWATFECRVPPPRGWRGRHRSPSDRLFFHLGRARDAALAVGSYDLSRELLELEVRAREAGGEPDDPAP